MKSSIWILIGIVLATPSVFAGPPARRPQASAPIEEPQAPSDVLRTEIVASTTISSFGFSDTATVVKTDLHVKYLVLPGLQVGIVSSYANQTSNSANLTTFIVGAGPTFNFPFEKPQDSFFVGGLVGLTVVSARAATALLASSATKFTFGFEGGKKFQLAENVSYRPSVGAIKISGSDWVVSFTPVSFGLHF